MSWCARCSCFWPPCQEHRFDLPTAVTRRRSSPVPVPKAARTAVLAGAASLVLRGSYRESKSPDATPSLMCSSCLLTKDLAATASHPVHYRHRASPVRRVGTIALTPAVLERFEDSQGLLLGCGSQRQNQNADPRVWHAPVSRTLPTKLEIQVTLPTPTDGKLPKRSTGRTALPLETTENLPIFEALPNGCQARSWHGVSNSQGLSMMRVRSSFWRAVWIYTLRGLEAHSSPSTFRSKEQNPNIVWFTTCGMEPQAHEGKWELHQDFPAAGHATEHHRQQSLRWMCCSCCTLCRQMLLARDLPV